MIRTTKAAILTQINQPLEIDELIIPELKRGQVLVQIAYSGVCHSQLNEIRGLKGEMDRRIVYGNKGFVQEMTAAYKISEKIKPKGRQMGWRKNKENRPL